MTPYHGHAYFPNPHHVCGRCGRDLWDRLRRLRNPNSAPAIFVTLDDEILCQRCFCKPKKETDQMGKKPIQLLMFTHEDLPLWSGAAPRVDDEQFDPEPVDRQETWAECRFCRDTGVLAVIEHPVVGVIDHSYCFCRAGDEAKARARSQKK